MEPDPETDLWLQWADQQADRLDPLTDSAPSVLDHEQEVPRW